MDIFELRNRLVEDYAAFVRSFISIRDELDAAFFHLYLGTEEDWKRHGSRELLEYFPTPRDAASYMMDTFRILKERDEAAHGSFRTKEAILQAYDQMAEAIRAAQPYQPALEPTLGPLVDADGNFIP